MLQRYEKGGEKGASVRALAPDFFPALVPFFILAPFPGLCRFFSRSALLGLCPFPATRSATCSAARPLFPLRYVPSRSLFRLRCVRPFLSACRRRPSGPPLSRARRRSSRVAAQTSAHSPASPFTRSGTPSPPRCARSVRPRRPVTSFRPKNCPIVREKMQKITLPALSRFLIVIFFTFLKVFIPLCRRTPCCGPLPAGARGDDRARRRNALTTTGQRI